MNALGFIVFLVIGGLLNFVIKPKIKFVQSLSKAYVFLVILVGVSAWLFYFAGIKNIFLKEALKFLMDWGSPAGYLIFGYLLIYIFLSLNRLKDNKQIRQVLHSALLGISILTGNWFILGTVGKIVQFNVMSAYFTTWGYALWFLYFIMAAETIGAAGIILHFQFRTGVWATLGLIAIMLGAIYTHWHHRDPFSDSYAAVTQLVTLFLMLILYYFERQLNIRSVPVTPDHTVFQSPDLSGQS